MDFGQSMDTPRAALAAAAAAASTSAGNYGLFLLIKMLIMQSLVSFESQKQALSNDILICDYFQYSPTYGLILANYRF